MVMVDKDNAPYKDGDPGNSELVVAEERWPVEEHEVFSMLRNISSGEKTLGPDATSWAAKAADMCRRMGDSLHLDMVGGESPPNTSNIWIIS